MAGSDTAKSETKNSATWEVTWEDCDDFSPWKTILGTICSCYRHYN